MAAGFDSRAVRDRDRRRGSTEAGFTAVVSYTRVYDLGGTHGKTGSLLCLLRRE